MANKKYRKRKQVKEIFGERRFADYNSPETKARIARFLAMK